MPSIPSRIKKHVRIKAGELIPHELNPRTHTDDQRAALQALYEEVGFARSLLAYELPDGRLKLIDGHLRASMDPGQEVDVEVLDVNDEEARKLLLSIDPLAQLAEFDTAALDELRAQVQSDNNTLNALWASISQQDEKTNAEIRRKTRKPKEDAPEQFMVMIECKDEQTQIALLRRFKKEGLSCRAVTS